LRPLQGLRKKLFYNANNTKLRTQNKHNVVAGGLVFDAFSGGDTAVEGVFDELHFGYEVGFFDEFGGGVAACHDYFNSGVSGIDDLFDILELG